MTHRITRFVAATLVLGLVGAAGVGCSSGPGKSPYVVATTTTAPPPALRSGQGYLQLAGVYYRFDVVGCRYGRSGNDPFDASRIFGVYGNGTTQGQLFTVELTQYRADAGARGPATITDTAVVRMQGGTKAKPFIIGLRAQRAQVVGSGSWLDKLDSKAVTGLIARNGDQYAVSGEFGPEGAVEGDPGVQHGRVGAVCPAGSDTDTGLAPSTSAPGGTSAPTSTTSAP